MRLPVEVSSPDSACKSGSRKLGPQAWPSKGIFRERFRTELDALEAERREVDALRVTFLRAPVPRSNLSGGCHIIHDLGPQTLLKLMEQELPR